MSIFILRILNHSTPILLLLWRNKYQLIYLDFWVDPKLNQMNVNYNFTGYYAIQVNSLTGSIASVDEYSNIPGNGMSIPLSTLKNVAFNIND